jgi:hypothetical protein
MQKFKSNPEQYIDRAKALNPEGYGDKSCKAA